MTDDKITSLCDPWEAKEFQKLITSVPDHECSHCLPDCQDTIYETSVSAAPFKPCDHTNLGTSPLCDLEADDLNPPIWDNLVKDEFKAQVGSIPGFMTDNKSKFSNIRHYVPNPERVKNLAFKSNNLKHPTYDAYKEDIAMVNFYFEKPTILQFKRAERMTMVDYVSQMGGLLGLGIGFSFISGVEIIYWLTFRLGRNIAESDNKKGKKAKSRRGSPDSLDSTGAMDSTKTSESWITGKI